MKLTECVRKGAAKISRSSSRRSIVSDLLSDPSSELILKKHSTEETEKSSLDLNMRISHRDSTSSKRRGSSSDNRRSSSSEDRRRSKSRERRSQTSSSSNTTKGDRIPNYSRSSTHSKISSSSTSSRRPHLSKSVSAKLVVEERDNKWERLAEDITSASSPGKSSRRTSLSHRRESPVKQRDGKESDRYHRRRKRSASRSNEKHRTISRVGSLLATSTSQEEPSKHNNRSVGTPALSTTSSALASASASAAAAAASAATAAALAASLIPAEDASFETPCPERLAHIADIVAQASQAASQAATAAQELVTLLTMNTNTIHGSETSTVDPDETEGTAQTAESSGEFLVQ